VNFGVWPWERSRLFRHQLHGHTDDFVQDHPHTLQHHGLPPRHLNFDENLVSSLVDRSFRGAPSTGQQGIIDVSERYLLPAKASIDGGRPRYSEKGSDLSGHTKADLKRIQDTLNRPPRPTLNLDTPAQRLAALLDQAA
jgi:hypothetical protein